MSSEKSPLVKTQLHPRNRNREQYDLTALISTVPLLDQYIFKNKFGNSSIDFSNPTSVRLLNQALLHHYYGIKYWEFPEKNLTPPIPGKADYIHYMADLLSLSNQHQLPKGKQIRCLDIGTGASCIYPIIGVVEYDWSFIATDIEASSISAAELIVEKNPSLTDSIKCLLQPNKNHIFKGIVKNIEPIDLAICNPPFHSSEEEAHKGTLRKTRNLSRKRVKNPKLNFQGVSSELVCEGGELAFISQMVSESASLQTNCLWFSSLVSKEANLKPIKINLEKIGAKEIVIMPMNTGNKSSRIVAWTFQTKKQRMTWASSRWH